MVLPVAYMAPTDWYRAYLACPEKVEIEGWESFEKQTCRNRCTISGSNGEEIRLSVPVKKVEHKQFTRDIETSLNLVPSPGPAALRTMPLTATRG